MDGWVGRKDGGEINKVGTGGRETDKMADAGGA